MQKKFNTLADSPLYRIRKLQKWIEYTKLMWDKTSLRKAAKTLNITLRSSFRWRHTFMKVPAHDDSSELMGVIGADKKFLPETFKGKKKLARKSRKRGVGRIKLIPIFIALDRTVAISHKAFERNTK